jgi:hypothetical protein
MLIIYRPSCLNPVTVISRHSYVISPLTHIVTPVVMESLSVTPYL